MKPIVMICFARSGGTLLNRCLGAIPNVVMLSEINPLGGGWGMDGKHSFTTIEQQAKNWYGYDLHGDSFGQNVNELNKICMAKKKSLIIRDWSFVNFVPCPQNNHCSPNRLLILDELKAYCNFCSFALVRDSIDIWISRGMPSIKHFYQQYNRYVNQLLENEIKIYKYEDLCLDTEKVLIDICNEIGIEFSQQWKNFNAFYNVNGDVQLGNNSRNLAEEQIKLLPRKRIGKLLIKEIEGCKIMKDVNALLGYSESYFSRPIEQSFYTKLEKVK